MKIFKFGGVSIKDAEGIRNVAKIISSYREEKPVLIISASGKTTNALEGVVNAFYHGEGDASRQLDEIESAHEQLIDCLFEDPGPVKRRIAIHMESVRQFMHHTPRENFDFIYDQIVSLGELLSTIIVSDYFKSGDLDNDWLDARSVIRTNNYYREARIDWEVTTEKILNQVKPLIAEKMIVTQGFIGGTTENLTTTLGREGSDFSASIFGYVLNAEEVVIWKDVTGVLNADPRLFSSVTKIDHLSYRDAIEMTYYGAKVIHPKTIKPLQNKKIPLRVRSFIDTSNPGTLIREDLEFSFLPPVIVIKKNQILCSISSKDFSFIAEENLSYIYSLFAKLRIKINMMKNTAISFTVSFDNDKDKVKTLLEKLQENFITEYTENLQLLTIHHYNDTVKGELTAGFDVLLEETFKTTVQFLMRKRMDGS